MTTTQAAGDPPRQPATCEALPPREVAFGSGGLQIKSLTDAYRFAQYIASSAFCPKNMQAADILVAIQYGAELGLEPVQAVQNIAVINGRPSLWGDALLALCRKSPLFVDSEFAETFTGKPSEDAFHAVCQVQRKGSPRSHYTFSVADAKKAGLWGKQGTWQTNPKRMLRYRARAFALRDAFPDVLKGLYSREEMLDAALDAVDLGDNGNTKPLPEGTKSAQLAKQLAPPAEPAPEPVPDPEPEQPPDLMPLRADILERLLKLPPTAHKELCKAYDATADPIGMRGVVAGLDTAEALNDLKLACVDAAGKARTAKKDKPDA